MTIAERIRSSSEFKKLAKLLKTPAKEEKGRIFTASQTTIDSRKLILKALLDTQKVSLIYSTIASVNVEKYFESIETIEKFKYQELIDILESNEFERVEKVDESGQYSKRGDTITVWSSVYNHPLRVSFWGESLEDIVLIDEVYRNKIDKTSFIVLGDEKILESDSEREEVSLFSVKYKPVKNFLIFTNSTLKSDVNFRFHYPTLFFNRLDLFEKEVYKKVEKGWEIFVSTSHKKRIKNILKDNNVTYLSKNTFKSGFENSKLKIAAFTDRELFGTIFISQEKQKRNNKKKTNKYLAQLEGEINIGDYIVHEDYGIAVYKGIKQKRVMGKMLDYFILEYAQKDKLSVPMTQVHKLTKYIGADRKPPRVTRLGKTSWKRVKKKVKKSIVFMARELLKLYAKAEVATSEVFTKHEWEDKFASEFEFEETDDQKRAIEDILNDLEKKKPMNRLLVGDVGFGKTEVALRAAFRTIMNGKQVAVLCPTTILVSQHNNVFSLRMEDYPIRLETLSRFGTRSENAEIVKDLNDGKVDLVIGTHRLLSNDIKFDDLGLLIIDEEQKFGVKQKEKIRKVAHNTNVLTMSATPIPRTLSMALSSLRDISIITTPPPGRKPIKNKLKKFEWKSVAEAIRKEVERGGQVYLVHNEVRTISSVKNKLKQLLPDVKFEVGHGQMHPSTLAKVMRDFYKGKFDCLVCTTIIENGIDIKNVNTIIINKAEKFGLAQLYQLRGRVGRGEKQAYCYLFYTHRNLMTDNKHMKELRLKGKHITFDKARSRLNALMEAQDLGSGFKIASSDLEIRGAGNLLGKEQHGNISAIGLGLYTQLLGQEVERIRNDKMT